MNSYKKINNLIGYTLGVFATIIYNMTKEGSISLWDCGEFVSTAYKLEVAHSPGAPLFAIIGRIFTLFTSGDGVSVAVNFMSALTSGLTISFLFWTITIFAKKLTKSKDLSSGETIGIFGSGIIGALAFTFSDTFWFSAVEGEVYAFSSLLTAIVIWAMLKWEEKADEPHADRWIVLIAFIMGLSIGVHLLNLLTIPALALIYYFKKKSNPKPLNILLAFFVGFIILIFVQYGIVIYLPKMAYAFDVLFVNDFGLPFTSGIIFFFILLIGLLIFLFKYSIKKTNYFLQLSVWCITFILIGYSVYITTIIRSKADTTIDMGNPDDATTLVPYLSRDQYGSVPIFNGPFYTSKPSGIKDLGAIYFRTEDKYETYGNKREYEYDGDQLHLFPRIWDGNSEPHKQFYQSFLGLGKDEEPSQSDNIRFFFAHQFWQMYGRYIMWNFAGRANDYQGRFYSEPMNSPWATGISALDNSRIGDHSKLPDGYKNNKAKNYLFGLPLILGILGAFFYFKRRQYDALVILTLFIMTGIAIMVFVNNTPDQPRERDYSYVGSTYAFAIWIGLGVYALSEILKKYIFKNNFKMAATVASILSFVLVPVIMLNAGWDDHDRSDKTIGHATGINYLTSCPKNAILFTEGDNDTYPLWYAQEVLGYRTDVRIINLSLLGIDWYIDQMRYKVNDAPAVKMMWDKMAYRSSKRDGMPVAELLPADSFYNLADVLKISNDDQYAQKGQDGSDIYVFPAKQLKLAVNKEQIIKNKIVPASMYDKIVSEIRWTINKTYLMKNDNALLNIIASNMFERPICFSTTINPDNFQGLEQYLLLEGMTYRLAPIHNPNANVYEAGTPNTEKMWTVLMDSFEFGGATSGKVYFDEPNRRTLTNFRAAYSKLAKALILQGDLSRAKRALDYCEAKIHLNSLPNDISRMWIGEAYMMSGNKKQAQNIALSFAKDAKDFCNYRKTLPEHKKDMVFDDLRQNFGIVQQFFQWASYQYADPEIAKKMEETLNYIITNDADMSAFVKQQQMQQQQQQQQQIVNPLAQ